MNNSLEAINDQCGINHTMPTLSITTAVLSGILMIPTIPLNIILIYIIIKVRKGRIPIFYKLLLNIAAADLMTGLIADPTSLTLHLKEAALKTAFSVGEAYLLHLSLFLTDAVALITMTFLSFDRIVVLLYPVKYHNGMKTRNENIIVAVIYLLAILLVAPYFKINFIKQLILFSTLNISLALLSIIATITVLQRTGGIHHNKIQLHYKSPDINERNIEIEKENSKMRSATPMKIQNKVTKTFLIMVGVFIVMYLPTCVTMIYMNSCGNGCDCFIIHVMRDVSAISILSSSVFRPLTYLLTIRQLREAMQHIFRR